MKSVALAETVQAAPVPRASVRLHAVEVPVEVWVLVPFRVTADNAGAAVVAERLAPETVELTVSAEAGASPAAREIPTTAIRAETLEIFRMYCMG
ncbi:hypothetical protein GCM10007170_45410 [Arthrobacter liuii]|uniref:Uncharacterized protein n=1 Tax=Arthrobacter liuii TaxID=1476996 RepID=A0ABQ2B224_9MICC|nr:hypothetical protein GCM10007170_45410 [Arthrobacter liuii]